MVKYKRTLGVEAGGDIYRDAQQESAFFDGIRGVKQELKITLATVEGEQPFAPDFGLDVFEIAGGGEFVIQREVRLALRDDDRVRSVDEVLVDIDEANRTADLTVNLTLMEGENLQLNETIEG